MLRMWKFYWEIQLVHMQTINTFLVHFCIGMINQTYSICCLNNSYLKTSANSLIAEMTIVQRLLLTAVIRQVEVFLTPGWPVSVQSRFHHDMDMTNINNKTTVALSNN